MTLPALYSWPDSVTSNSSSPLQNAGLPFFGNYTPIFPSEEEDDSGGGLGEDAQPAELVALAAIYTVVLFVGIFGNGSLLVALVSQHSARIRNPLLVGLCAADLLVCACSAPLAAAREALPLSANTSPCATVGCVLQACAQYFPVSASTLSLMMLSIDRYTTVQHPRLLSGLQRYPLITAVSVWLGAAILCIPVLLARSVPLTTPHLHTTLLISHILLVYLIPATTVMLCHLGVRSKLCALSLTARAAHGELPLPMPLLRRPTHVIIVAGMANAQTQAVTYGCEDEDDRKKRRSDSKKYRKRPTDGPVRGSNQRRSKRQENLNVKPSLLATQPQTSTLQSRRRLANVLVTVAAVFAACWMPHAFFCLYAELHKAIPEYLLQYSLLLGHAHSAINPVVYWALNHQTLNQQGCLPCSRGGAAHRFLFHFKFHDEQPPSSTNEAALGAFNPRYTRARPRIERAAPSSHYLY